MARWTSVAVAALVVSAGSSGCVMVEKTGYAKMLAPEVPIPEVHISDLRREDYRIIGPVTGKVCVAQDANGVIRDDKGTVVGNAGPGVDLVMIARNLAMYRALESVPSADALFSPRYHEEFKMDASANTVSCCAAVTGKAIELKTDPK